jgi:hypothetical protein
MFHPRSQNHGITLKNIPGTVRFGDYDRLWLQSPAVEKESPIYCMTTTVKIASAEAARLPY